MPVTSRFAALLLVACTHAPPPSPPPPPPPPPSPPLAAVDVFDPDPQVVERVTARHAASLRAIVHEHSPAQVHALEAEIRADGDHAYVEASLVTYFEDGKQTSYLTVDLVETRDAARRIPFAAPPTGSSPDPAGLLATWDEHEAAFHALLARNEWADPKRCPALHCLGDPDHPALRATSQRMVALVPAHVDELAQILRDDHRSEHRAAAAYLLAYAPDSGFVVAHLTAAIRDPDMVVRNNAMRVLALIALHHPEIDVPIAPVLAALSYPSSTDRNKAGATVAYLLRRPNTAALHAPIRRAAGPILLAMLRLHQPNNHDFAYQILKQISGETYGERDLAAWQAWLARARD